MVTLQQRCGIGIILVNPISKSRPNEFVTLRYVLTSFYELDLFVNILYCMSGCSEIDIRNMNEIIDRNIILSLREHEREMYILFCGFVNVHASMEYGFHLHPLI